MLLGAHVSIAGGIDTAIARGQAMGATAIQTFASSPRSLKFSPFSDEAVERYKVAKAASAIKVHVFHGVYLINLASEKPDYVSASVDSLIAYQQAAASIGALGTIFHVGSHKGSGFETVKKTVAEAIYRILEQSPPETVLMLENAAGAAGTIGRTVEELAELLEAAGRLGARADQLGICLDTQHAFASGVDIRDKKALDLYLDRVERLIGLKRVKVIHINDSKTGYNSHKDRHENLGEGELGLAGLAGIIGQPRLRQIPMILEVPGPNGKGPEQADLNQLKSIYEKTTAA